MQTSYVNAPLVDADAAVGAVVHPVVVDVGVVARPDGDTPLVHGRKALITHQRACRTQGSLHE